MESALLITVSDRPGTLFQLSKVLADHRANITYVDIIHRRVPEVQVYFEFELDAPLDKVISDLRLISNVRNVSGAKNEHVAAVRFDKVVAELVHENLVAGIDRAPGDYFAALVTHSGRNLKVGSQLLRRAINQARLLVLKDDP